MTTTTTSAPCAVCSAARERLVDAEVGVQEWEGRKVEREKDKASLSRNEKRAMSHARKALDTAEVLLDAAERECPNHTQGEITP